MEKKQSQHELLRNLINAALSPFATIEKINDIKEILASSNKFSGINHLILVETYLDDNLFPFVVNKEEAYTQCELAIKEENKIGYYYLYLLDKDSDPNKARANLIIAADYGYPKALVEIGKLKKEGILFEKNRKQAYEYFKKATEKNSLDGYFYLLIMAEEDGDLEKAKQIINEANQNGFTLPGVVK